MTIVTVTALLAALHGGQIHSGPWNSRFRYILDLISNFTWRKPQHGHSPPGDCTSDRAAIGRISKAEVAIRNPSGPTAYKGLALRQFRAYL